MDHIPLPPRFFYWRTFCQKVENTEQGYQMIETEAVVDICGTAIASPVRCLDIEKTLDGKLAFLSSENIKQWLPVKLQRQVERLSSNISDPLSLVFWVVYGRLVDGSLSLKPRELKPFRLMIELRKAFMLDFYSELDLYKVQNLNGEYESIQEEEREELVITLWELCIPRILYGLGIRNSKIAKIFNIQQRILRKKEVAAAA